MSKTTEAMNQAESIETRFDLHDSRRVCRMFLDVCRRYDLGKLEQHEMVQACMLVADEAENLGLRDPLKDWEA